MLLPRSIRECINFVDNMLVDDFVFLDKGSDILFVTFAGMTGIRKTTARVKHRLGFGTAPFEFVHSLEDKACDVMFLRDRYKAYYHSGVKGVGKDIKEVAGFLNDFIEQRRYKLVVTLGHSMGGYASLLFASKIGAEICIAISPPTFLDEENRNRYGDLRYDHEKRKLCDSGTSSHVYLDLRSYFLSSVLEKDAKSCTYCLFYGGNDKLDEIHATRMADLPQSFHLYEVKGSGHNAARAMRDSGLLFSLINNILLLKHHRNVGILLKSVTPDAYEHVAAVQ